jgi:regulator of replication initiation timing
MDDESLKLQISALQKVISEIGQENKELRNRLFHLAGRLSKIEQFLNKRGLGL